MIYVLADNLTDFIPVVIFNYFNTVTVLFRILIFKEIYPSVDPFNSSFKILDIIYLNYIYLHTAEKIKQLP